VIDPEKFTVQYWGALRRHAYRMTGSILDAEDVVQETMLRAVEMGSSLENVADHFEWLHIAATEAAVPLLEQRRPVSIDDFDLPDLVQTTGPGADPDSVAVDGDVKWPGAALGFLFPLQYLDPAQRAVVVLDDGFEDSSRMAAEALHLTVQEISVIAEEVKKRCAAVRKRWGSTVPFGLLQENEKTAKVYSRFLEAFQMKDAALLQQLLWKDAEMVLESERTTGRDFVATELALLSKGMGEPIRFGPVWLNGCRGVLIAGKRELRSEWSRMALALILCNEREVRAIKWYLDGHILRGIQADDFDVPTFG